METDRRSDSRRGHYLAAAAAGTSVGLRAAPTSNALDLQSSCHHELLLLRKRLSEQHMIPAFRCVPIDLYYAPPHTCRKKHEYYAARFALRNSTAECAHNTVLYVCMVCTRDM